MPISGEDVFDLQIFAETAQEPGTEPVGVSQGESQGEPQPEQSLENILASILGAEQQPAQTGQEPPPAQGTETEQSITESASQQTVEPGQQTTTTQTEQQPDPMRQILELQQQQQQMMGMFAQMMQQNQQSEEPELELEPPEMFTPQIPENLPEDLQEEVNELYLDDPAKALAKVAKWQQEQLIKQQREYMIQQQKEQYRRQQETQQQFVQGFTKLIQQHGRQAVDELGPRIEQIMLKEHPELLNFPQVGVQVAFQLAQAEKAKQTTQSDPATFLQQPNIRQKIKDAVRQEIITEYLQGVQTNNQAPATIAGQPGAAPTVTPPSKPKTFDEAVEAMLKAYGSS